MKNSGVWEVVELTHEGKISAGVCEKPRLWRLLFPVLSLVTSVSRPHMRLELHLDQQMKSLSSHFPLAFLSTASPRPLHLILVGPPPAPLLSL